MLHGLYSYSDYLSWEFDTMVELIKGRVFLMAAPIDLEPIFEIPNYEKNNDTNG
jgi:hypothetical protein